MSYVDINLRAHLGVDGNCGFALLGEDIQEGECEFVEIPVCPTMDSHSATLWACKEALKRLRTKLGAPAMSYYFGPSHPYGG